MDRGASCFPLYLRDDHAERDENGIRKRPNVTRSVTEKLAAVGLSPADLFHHVVAVLHAPAYRAENAGALRMDWPRVPFPTPAEALRRSADLGRQLAALLDPEASVPRVTTGALRPELAIVAQPRRTGGGPLRDDDLKLAGGWGYRGQGGAVMPGQGLVRAREYTEGEAGALAAGASGLDLAPSDMLALLGSTCDVHLNVEAYWANISSECLGAYARRLSGTQEVAQLPRGTRARPSPEAGGGRLHERDGAADRGYPAARPGAR